MKQRPVTITQNSAPGGSHFGTNIKLSFTSLRCPMPKPMAEIPKSQRIVAISRGGIETGVQCDAQRSTPAANAMSCEPSPLKTPI